MKFLWLLVGALLLQSCGSLKNKRSADSRPEVVSPDAASDAFVVEEDNQGGFSIGVRKTALEKEFLLQGSMISQQKVAQFNNMKSRVVAFRVVNKEIHMLEATQGHTISKDLPQNLVLVSFPITKISADVVYFDFIRGMKEISLVGDWYAHDDKDGMKYKEEYLHAKVSQSYLEEARVVKDRNALVIRQISQVTALKPAAAKEPSDEEDSILVASQIKFPVEARYYLTPYRPSKDFQPTATQDFERYGFFEVSPQLSEDGSTQVLASRFDHKKPVVYAISSNTPEDFRQAIKDGVLYWNKAFGREVVRVIDVPDTRTAPDYEYNIIQWVKWDDAGYAYADAQMDPRTGEILHAQIFLTSAFAISGRKSAERAIAVLERAPKPMMSFGLKGLSAGRLCDRQVGRQFAMSLSSLLAAGMDDEGLKQAAADYVREVVAHEVGHTLGMRHNFAGSLGASYDQISRRELMRAYLDNTLPADFVTSSTVMDYQLFEESIATGRYIARAEGALAYDVNAINKLYENKDVPKKDSPLFCTDSHAEEFVDCKVFDSGRQPLAFRAKNPRDVMERVPYNLANSYVTLKKAGNEKDGLRVGTLNPGTLATSLYEARADLVAFFRGDRKVLRVRRGFDYINTQNEEAVRSAEEKYIEDNVRHVGGVAQLFSALPADSFNQLVAETLYYVNKDVSLSDDDVKSLTEEIQHFAKKLPLALEKEQLKFLGNVDHVRGGQLGDDFSLFLRDEAQRILLSEKVDGARTVITLDDQKTVTIPTYMYPRALRQEAIKLVTAKEGDSQWGALERYELRKALSEHLCKVLGLKSEEDIVPSAYPRDVARWILETQQFIGVL